MNIVREKTKTNPHSSLEYLKICSAQNLNRSVNALNALRIRTGAVVVTSPYQPEVLNFSKHVAQLMNRGYIRGSPTVLLQCDDCCTGAESMFPPRKFCSEQLLGLVSVDVFNEQSSK